MSLTCPKAQEADEQPAKGAWFPDERSFPSPPGSAPVSMAEEAYGLLVKLHFVALRILRNAADAEDVVTQTLMRQIEGGFRTYDPSKGPLKAYLTTLVKNDCFKFLREARKVVPISAIPNNLLAASGGDTVGEIADEERVRAVHRCLAMLKEEDRTILILRYFEELRVAEIAEGLGISEPAAKVRLLRARKRFLKKWSILQRGVNND